MGSLSHVTNQVTLVGVYRCISRLCGINCSIPSQLACENGRWLLRVYTSTGLCFGFSQASIKSRALLKLVIHSFQTAVNLQLKGTNNLLLLRAWPQLAIERLLLVLRGRRCINKRAALKVNLSVFLHNYFHLKKLTVKVMLDFRFIVELIVLKSRRPPFLRFSDLDIVSRSFCLSCLYRSQYSS